MPRSTPRPSACVCPAWRCATGWPADRARSYRPSPSFEFSDGTVVLGEVSGVGADWVALEPDHGRAGAVLAPFGSLAASGCRTPTCSRSARPGASRSELADRLTLGFVLRDLVRRRLAVVAPPRLGPPLHRNHRPCGRRPPRSRAARSGCASSCGAVTGHRIVPFAASLDPRGRIRRPVRPVVAGHSPGRDGSSVAAADGAGAPQLREARAARLTPQGHARVPLRPCRRDRRRRSPGRSASAPGEPTRMPRSCPSVTRSITSSTDTARISAT